MRKLLVVVILTVTGALLLGGGPGSARDLSFIEDVLVKIDAQSRFEDTDFSALMTMIVEDPEKGIEKMVVRQFRRDDGQHFLLLVQEPKTQRGQGYLLEGENLWFYDPSSRKFAHTSLKETFQDSDARNADFSQWNFSSSYRVQDYQEGTLGQFPVYIIDLEAVADTVPFPYVKLWVTQDTPLVLKNEEYSLTKRLMRSTLFPKYARVGAVLIPTQMILVDELVEGKKTQIGLSEISTGKIPDYVFTKAYFEQVNR